MNIHEKLGPRDFPEIKGVKIEAKAMFQYLVLGWQI